MLHCYRRVSRSNTDSDEYSRSALLESAVFSLSLICREDAYASRHKVATSSTGLFLDGSQFRFSLALDICSTTWVNCVAMLEVIDRYRYRWVMWVGQIGPILNQRWNFKMNEATDDPFPHQAYLFNSTCRSSSKALRDVSEEGPTAVAWLFMVSCLSSLSLWPTIRLRIELSRRFF